MGVESFKMTLIEEINKALINVIYYICKNPLIFVSESDIHTLIMEKLTRIAELKSSKLHPTKCTIGLNQSREPSKETYKTMRIHREYGHADLDYSRSDIVILNPVDIKEITVPTKLKTGNLKSDYVIPEYIFEFGTEKVANSEKAFRKHLKEDIKKVNKSKVRGYIIHIQRNLVGAKGLENNKLKYESYVNAIQEECKKAKPNVKILIMILNIGNENRIITKEEKTKIYKNNMFEGVNQKNIKEELYNVLN